MAHGTPDWGLVGPRRTTYGLDDMGELAVRLGSHHLWDRRGDVIYQSAFHDGLEAAHTFPGPLGITAGLSTGYSSCGSYSVQTVSDGVNAGSSGVQVYLPLPVYSRVGLEYVFTFREVNDNYEHDIYWQNALALYHAQVRYNVAAASLECWIEPGVWVVFANNLHMDQGDDRHNIIKTVVDMDAVRYVRCIANDVTHDLSAYTPQLAGGGGLTYLRVRMLVERIIGSMFPSFIDSIIVTQNEP